MNEDLKYLLQGALVLVMVPVAIWAIYTAFSVGAKTITTTHKAIWGDSAKIEVCTLVVDPVKREEVFLACLDKAGEARKGQSYTTHDDEDYDEVIEACASSAYYISKRNSCDVEEKEPLTEG